MTEQDNQDFHDNDQAPTGSRGTQRTQRGRGARARRRPSQTEILAGNVKDLTELVRTLVDNRRTPTLFSSPSNRPKWPSPRRADLAGRAADHVTPHRRAAEGAIGRAARARDGSSRSGQIRVEYGRGAATPRLPAQPLPSRRSRPAAGPAPAAARLARGPAVRDEPAWGGGPTLYSVHHGVSVPDQVQDAIREPLRRLHGCR
ncbi:hypothetical protein TIFTF001_040261 [Ficus carica]|uniref:Uncharacterized protein n=1 Tax=Ficus carica TaxID=3494 RepID=A0AA88CZ77_FICCA|nr:hypothetical protein TIFTF001_040261 [Ficus carica]